MSLRKKIILSFLISVLIVGTLATFEYINFIQEKNQMRFLEVADSARDRSLKILRHEKNFFLFPDKAAQESAATLGYLSELDGLTGDIEAEDPSAAVNLRGLITTYQSEFISIQALLAQISQGIDALGTTSPGAAGAIPLLKAESRDNPSLAAAYLKSSLSLPAGDSRVAALGLLSTRINQLRDTSNNIVTAANDLDKNTRSSAGNVINQSQLEILVVFPLFLMIGLGALLYVSSDVVKKVKALTGAIERISKLFGPKTPRPGGGGGRVRKDEVDILVDKFNRMNHLRSEWERRIREKNQEALLQAKKLAAIGTLASGVAHELNNPLNNISLSAQVLKKKIGAGEPPAVMRIVNDIVGQTERVRDIVSNLLEFARERELQLKKVNINSLVAGAYNLAQKSAHADGIEFELDSGGREVRLQADQPQLERAFVNLFTNAIAAIEGEGKIAVHISPKNGDLEILVSDTGKGIPPSDREKIFDPFFTKKDKGTGLGLAIVLSTIRKHEGQISVISEEGIGTIFEIILPLEKRP